MKKPYVAIVDDDSAFSNYLRTFLSLRGYETRSYSRGDELLASVKQGDPPDIVLLDVMMPGMNGLETLRALKAAKPDMQAIMLSGREQAATIVEAVASAPPTTSSSRTIPRGSERSHSTWPSRMPSRRTDS